MPAGAAELVLDITPGFLDGLRSRRAWPEVDQSLNMRESFFAREFFPDFCLRRSQSRRPKQRGEAENSCDLQGVSVKRHDRPMFLDWRLTQTPDNFH
jgi:hypothetical protein